MIAVPCLAAILIAIVVIAARDTWEADNAQRVADMAAQAGQLLEEKKYERAIEKYQELASFVHGRQIKDPQLRQLVSQAAQKLAEAKAVLEKQNNLIELEKLLDMAVRNQNSRQFSKSTEAFKMLLVHVGNSDDPDYKQYVDRANGGIRINELLSLKADAESAVETAPQKALDLYMKALAAYEKMTAKSKELDAAAQTIRETAEQLRIDVETAKIEQAKRIEAQRIKGQALWPIDSLGNLAYINSGGDIAVKTDLPFADCASLPNGAVFIDGLAVVARGKKHGLLTADGEMAVDPAYDDIRPSPEMIWAVKSGKKWGFIGRDGQFILGPSQADARPFSNGLAAVKPDKKWGFLDKTGAFAIEPQFEDAGQFGENLAPACTGGNWGYIDRTGKFAIQPIYRKVMPFAFGRARVGSDKGRTDRQWIFISENGEPINQEIYEDAGDFSDGMAWVKTGGKYSYVGIDGAMPIPAQYDSAENFAEELALVGQNRSAASASAPASGPAGGGGKKPVIHYMFIDKLGQTVLDLGDRPAGAAYRPAGAFKNGLCFALVDVGKEKHIEFFDKTGQAKFRAKGESAVPGPDVWKIVENARDKIWYLVNTEGKVVWKTPRATATVTVMPNAGSQPAPG